jgi:hypothetical protein
MAAIDVVAANVKVELKDDYAADLEFLARLFEDSSISDTGTGNDLQNRLLTILEASTDGSNGGVTHFAKIFAGCQDMGFRPAFKDPWPSSRNQVGHFTTAVDMGFRPGRTYLVIPSVMRKLILDSTSSPFLPVEERVCIALIIGHEQVADTHWKANYFATNTATRDDILKFLTAVNTVSRNPDWNVDKSHTALIGISIGKGVGNSIQDLHLSVYGYKLGKLIRSGDMTSRDDAALWIRTDIGGSLSDVVTQSDTSTA